MRCGKINRYSQKDKAESVFDGIHPVAGFREDVSAECTDNNQRYAGTECQDIKCQPTQDRITRLTDVTQSKCQRRSDTRADNQCGQYAHYENGYYLAAGKPAALILKI